jgi:hypothetical protein
MVPTLPILTILLGRYGVLGMGWVAASLVLAIMPYTVWQVCFRIGEFGGFQVLVCKLPTSFVPSKPSSR